MMMTWAVVVQWLHVVAGIVWFGGQVFTAFVLWPALLRRPAPEARAFLQAAAKPARAVMGISGNLVLLLGILRGTWLGPIRSVTALFASSYGLTFLAALALMVFVMMYGGAVRQRVMGKVWDGDQFQPGAAAYLRRSHALTLGALGGIVLCMVLMRFGL